MSKPVVIHPTHYAGGVKKMLSKGAGPSKSSALVGQKLSSSNPARQISQAPKAVSNKTF